MESWKYFTKYLKCRLKKLCKKDPANWDKYINQVLASYRVTPNLATAETPIFLVYQRDPNLPLHQLLAPMQCFLGDSESGKLNLEHHCLTLAIAKKTLDENHFRNEQKTTDRETLSNYDSESTSRINNQENGTSNGDLDTGLFLLSTVTLPAYRKSGKRKNKIMQC